MRFISRATRFPSSGRNTAARLISSTSGCTFTVAIFCSGIRRCRWVRWRPRNAWSSCALWRTGFVSASWKRSTSRWVWIRRRIWKGCPGCSTLQSYREGEMAIPGLLIRLRRRLLGALRLPVRGRGLLPGLLGQLLHPLPLLLGHLGGAAARLAGTVAAPVPECEIGRDRDVLDGR